jgi:hypothetical protein
VSANRTANGVRLHGCSVCSSAPLVVSGVLRVSQCLHSRQNYGEECSEMLSGGIIVSELWNFVEPGAQATPILVVTKWPVVNARLRVERCNPGLIYYYHQIDVTSV